jgi:hypothetical protein
MVRVHQGAEISELIVADMENSIPEKIGVLAHQILAHRYTASGTVK